ncbi:uncharacterized protein LOC5512527 isoform X2 [Nematostella vectensis]|nr:uncharacterized protein LOC5512527 isoform X2 [Nematostella vectensis]
MCPAISMDAARHTSCHWFRKDLRLHDNPALKDALDNADCFYGVFVLSNFHPSITSGNRWKFLLQCLQDLNNSLEELGSKLIILTGSPVEIFPKLLHSLKVTKLTFEVDTEPFAQQRDSVISHIARSAGIEVKTHASHTLYDIESLVSHCNENIPLVFDEFLEMISGISLPPIPVLEVKQVPCLQLKYLNSLGSTGIKVISSLKDVPCNQNESTWEGGETVGLQKLEEYLQQMVRNGFLPEVIDADVLMSNKGVLCPYLRFGCLSPRTVYFTLKGRYQKTTKRSAPPRLFSSLLWREFAFLLGSRNPDMHKTEGNSYCLQVPWRSDQAILERLRQGMTGFPWIDAIIRQLRQEGWVHDVAQQAVGCFLTWGTLWQSWEEGFKLFGELMLDAGWSRNAFNWLNMSNSMLADGPLPYFCPVDVGKAIDPSGKYIRKYIPELASFPSEFIHAPWTAPEEIQRDTQCVIGDDYPYPLVDHKEQRKINIQALQSMCKQQDNIPDCPSLGIASMHWFRKDLRLHDNPALLESFKNCQAFYGVYFLDPASVQRSNLSPNRWWFLLESLRDLDYNLRSLGSRLLVVRGQPVQEMPKLLDQWNIKRLTLEYDSEPPAKQRDAVVTHLAKNLGVEVIQRVSHTLYDVETVFEELYESDSYATWDGFLTFIDKLGSPEEPVDLIDWRMCHPTRLSVPETSGSNFDVPTLHELGINPKKVTCDAYWKGGEGAGLERLKLYVVEATKQNFIQPPICAEMLQVRKPHLDPYLRFGCVSPRHVYKELKNAYSQNYKMEAPVIVFESLLRREFYFYLSSANSNFCNMENNPISLQFPWEENKEGLERWKEGKTGFPWIDAIMRQLREEGWIHHLARQAVGCFLTRGCLWVSWEEGFKAFDELQLDAEWSLNAGNWLWLSCSSYVNGAVPWYCPVGVGKQIDPTGDYIKRYVPEVRGLPSEYVCEPWNAPLSVQKACRCVVGEDYPSPIVDHMEQRMICVQRMKQLSIDLGAKVPDNGCTSVHWFRKDLRLHDNPSLLASLDNCSTFFPIYVLDMESARASKISANRWNFLCECLEALDRQLRVLGSRLFVIRGRAMDVLPYLFHEWSVNRLTFERESEPAGRQRDAVIQMLAEKAKVQVLQHNAHLLYDTDEVLEINDGKLPMTFDKMAKTAEQLGPPCPPCQTVDKTVFGACLTPVGPDHADKYGVPLLSEFGMKELKEATAKKYWTGGEPEALRRLSAALKKCAENDFEERGWTIDEMFSNDAHLSPYMRFGCLSPRLYYQQLALTYMKEKKSIPPATLFTGLVRRELFLHVASHNADLDKMVDNPLSVQFPWEENKEGLERWKNGKTGFPWIDAIMRQLREEGWIHHLARQAVGCFLTRGCLWVSWEEGFKAFDELQLDAEWSLNASNWLWLSCSSYVHGAVPWYCPVEVGKKVDPTGDYIK